MGFFSWKCKKCSHSIKSPYDLPAGWDYMNECVLLRDGWDPVIGKYDGYGNIEGSHGEHDINWGAGEPELWHKRCWESEDKPAFSGGSKYAEDQGYFYDDPSDEQLVEAIRATE